MPDFQEANLCQYVVPEATIDILEQKAAAVLVERAFEAQTLERLTSTPEILAAHSRLAGEAVRVAGLSYADGRRGVKNSWSMYSALIDSERCLATGWVRDINGISTKGELAFKTFYNLEAEVPHPATRHPRSVLHAATIAILGDEISQGHAPHSTGALSTRVSLLGVLNFPTSGPNGKRLRLTVGDVQRPLQSLIDPADRRFGNLKCALRTIEQHFDQPAAARKP